MPLPTITLPPAAPSPSDEQSVFDSKAYAFVSWQVTFASEINSFISWVGADIDVTKTIRAPEDLDPLPGIAGRQSRFLRFDAFGNPDVRLAEEVITDIGTVAGSSSTTKNSSKLIVLAGIDSDANAVRAALNVQNGAQANVPTNLALTGSGDSRTITSSTGDDAVLPISSASNAGLMSTARTSKLDALPDNVTLSASLSARELIANKRTSLASPDNTTFPTTLAVASEISMAMAGETPMGAWNAATNTPALASSVGTAGHWYEVSVPGTTNLNGEDDWQQNDKAIFNGIIWTRTPANGVRSVDGRTGAVILNYNTVADAAAASLPVGAKFSTKGADVIGEGGGDFIVSATALTAEDGYSCFEIASGNYAVLLPVNGAVLPEQFGCQESSSNCSTNFQLLVAYAIANNVRISGAGDYFVENIQVGGNVTITSPVKMNLKLPVGSTQRRVILHTAGTLYLNDVNLDSVSGTVGCYTLLSEGAAVIARNCNFSNAQAISGYGEGVLVNESSSLSIFDNCEFSDNGASGLSVAESPNILISQCRSYGNGQQGFYLNNYDLTFTKKINNVVMSDCYAYDNTGSGFALGNLYNDHDPNGDDFGHTNETCSNVQMSNCHAYNNTNYGFGISAYKGAFSNLHAHDNGFGGALINGRYLDFTNPQIYSNGDYGIDVGFGRNINITGGTVAFNATAGAAGGLLIEAALNVNVSGTKVYGNGSVGNPNIVVAGVGGTGDGRYFPVKCSTVTLACDVDCADGRRGLLIKDNPDNVIDNNTYSGTDQLLYTRYALAAGSINNSGAAGRRSYYTATATSGVIVGPDIETTVLTNEAINFTDFRPYSYNFFRGKISYITVSGPGTGHVVGVTTAVITGDGTGATATPIINNGALIGVRVDNPGSGYTTASVTIGGAGSGATATAKVNLDLLGGLTWTVAFNQVSTVTTAALPAITYPSVPATINAPAAGAITLTERYGSWLLTSKNF